MATDGVTAEIEEIAGRETRAWSARDVDLLLSVFHPDIVLAVAARRGLPRSRQLGLRHGPFRPGAMAPVVAGALRQPRSRPYRREIVRITATEERDGAFAVVDVDTLWRRDDGADFHWKGRACKVYTRVAGEWKLIMHTGLLRYPVLGG